MVSRETGKFPVPKSTGRLPRSTRTIACLQQLRLRDVSHNSETLSRIGARAGAGRDRRKCPDGLRFLRFSPRIGFQCDRPTGRRRRSGPGRAAQDEGLRRRFAVATLPEGIDAADGPRQTVAFAEKIDGARFAEISGQDAEVSAIVVCERVADLRSGLRELFPAKFFAQIAVGHVYDVP